VTREGPHDSGTVCRRDEAAFLSRSQGGGRCVGSPPRRVRARHLQLPTITHSGRPGPPVVGRLIGTDRLAGMSGGVVYV
jgi:hypothetical protein